MVKENPGEESGSDEDECYFSMVIMHEMHVSRLEG